VRLNHSRHLDYYARDVLVDGELTLPIISCPVRAENILRSGGGIKYFAVQETS